MNYLLRNVDDDLWQRVRVKAMKERVTIRDLLIRVLRAYLAGRALDSEVDVRTPYFRPYFGGTTTSADFFVEAYGHRLILTPRQAKRATTLEPKKAMEYCAGLVRKKFKISDRSAPTA